MRNPSSGKTKLYHGESMRAMNYPDRRYWGTTASTSGTELKYLYSIGLLDLKTGKEFTLQGADPANRGLSYFPFPTPPQAYNNSEPAATTIIPTQGGKFVENQGNIFKDIRISGTVGLRPNPKEGWNPLPIGPSISVPDTPFKQLFKDERGLMKNEATGFDDIIFLRNIFRGYQKIKLNPEYRSVVMYWIYRKEDEAYIVEPISFTTDRASSSPLSWRYDIVLRTLYKFDTISSFIKDPLGFWGSITNAIATIRQATISIAKSIRDMASFANYLMELPYSLFSLGYSGPLSLASDVMDSALSVYDTCLNVAYKFKTFPTDFMDKINKLSDNSKKFVEVTTAFQRAIEQDNYRPWGKISDRPTDDPEDPAALKIHRNTQIYAAFKLARNAALLASLDATKFQSKQVVVEDYVTKYANSETPSSFSFSPLDPRNIKIPESAREVVVNQDDDIRSIAKQYLGDEGQWKKLAIINNLKAPYVSTQGGTNVLKPGDKILIPSYSEGNDISSVMNSINSDAEMESLTSVMRKYGRDLKLVENSDGLLDLEVGRNGDLALIEGVPNVEQALRVKFSTERGSLALHPEYGALYPIGTKIFLNKLQEFILNTRLTINQDPRISAIAELKVFSEGDIVNVKSRLILKDSDAELPINFSVRSA